MPPLEIDFIMSITLPLLIILLSSILIILSISTVYNRYKKSEYFASQDVYITKLNVINAFNKFLRKTPSSDEINKYSSYCVEKDLISQLRKDYPNRFRDPESVKEMKENNKKPKISQEDVMTSNTSRMRESQNQRFQSGENENESKMSQENEMTSSISRMREKQNRWV